MASQELKRLIAHKLACGERIADLARRHDYTYRGMAKLVKSDDVQALVAQEREALEERLTEYRAQMVLNGRYAVENVRRVVEDPNHPKNLETSRWLLDRMLFPRPDGPQVNVEVWPTSEATAKQLCAQVERLLQRPEGEPIDIDNDPHLMKPGKRPGSGRPILPLPRPRSLPPRNLDGKRRPDTRSPIRNRLGAGSDAGP
jgi:hypothetical protein